MSDRTNEALESLTTHASNARTAAGEFETLAASVDDIETQYEELDAAFKNAFQATAMGVRPRLLGATTVDDFQAILEDLETALKDPERQAARQALEALCETIEISLSTATMDSIEERFRALDIPQLRQARTVYEDCQDSLKDSATIIRARTRAYVNSDERDRQLTDYDRLQTVVTQLQARYDALTDIEAAFNGVTWAPDQATSLSDRDDYYTDLDDDSGSATAIADLVESIDRKTASMGPEVPVEAAIQRSVEGAFDGSFESLEERLSSVITQLGNLSAPQMLSGASILVEQSDSGVGRTSPALELATNGLPFTAVTDAYDVLVDASERVTVDDLNSQLETLKCEYSKWAKRTVERLRHHAETAEAVATRLPDAPAFQPSTSLTTSTDVEAAPGKAIDQLRAFATWVEDLEVFLDDETDGSAAVVAHWLRYEMGDPLSLQQLHDDELVGDLLELTEITIQKGTTTSDV